MATSAIARLTGTVIRKEHRDGIAKATGKAYDMHILTVLVGGAGTTEIIQPAAGVVSGSVPGVGEDIDWLVEVSRSERGFNLNVLGLYPEREALAIAAALQAV
jgi:hypothetical protein